MRGGGGVSCQVAEISAKKFKRGCKIYHLDEKNREFCQILKYFYSKPFKTYLLKVQAFLDLAEIFSLFGLTRPVNSG